MTRTGEREICSVSGRLPDNPGELARIFNKVQTIDSVSSRTILWSFCKKVKPICAQSTELKLRAELYHVVHQRLTQQENRFHSVKSNFLLLLMLSLFFL